jgi:hypothetical protein
VAKKVCGDIKAEAEAENFDWREMEGLATKMAGPLLSRLIDAKIAQLLIDKLIDKLFEKQYFFSFLQLTVS